MREHYVTIFDSLFLPQGLALQRSLEALAGDYTLWVVCVDDEVHRVLARLALPNVRALKLSEIETQELRRVRSGRSTVEFCWTLTPFAPRFVFEADLDVERVTYLDADLWFRRSPAPLFAEFDDSGKSVMITSHGYAPECDSSAATGEYCAQFITFRRGRGESVRRWWEDRCVEWCFARSEEGKFGDQKYLDDWPSRFVNEVHVLAHPEWTLGPWNVTRFPYGQAIVYHFHGLALIDDGGGVTFGNHILPPVVVRHVYEPYLVSLRSAVGRLKEAGFQPQPQRRPPGFAVTIRRLLGGVSSQRWRFKGRHVHTL